MKKLPLALAAAMVLLGVACGNKKETESTALPAATPAPAPAAHTYTGEIMDSTCAAMATHETMAQGEGAKNARDCTLKCVAGGGKFVLYDGATRIAYQLDDQAKPKEFAGRRVKVTGTADVATKTIHVQSIEGG
jgi:hypothetical protein